MVIYTPIERKSSVPQLQGVQGRSCSHLPRALGNAEDGVASAFPKGKQNEKNFLKKYNSPIEDIQNFGEHN
jgi:hypothetical protein